MTVYFFATFFQDFESFFWEDSFDPEWYHYDIPDDDGDVPDVPVVEIHPVEHHSFSEAPSVGDSIRELVSGATTFKELIPVVMIQLGQRYDFLKTFPAMFLTPTLEEWTPILKS